MPRKLVKLIKHSAELTRASKYQFYHLPYSFKAFLVVPMVAKKYAAEVYISASITLGDSSKRWSWYKLWWAARMRPRVSKLNATMLFPSKNYNMLKYPNLARKPRKGARESK